jgi:cyclopropane fatty-acyl-phospholipid synthase-like methyltransferase
MTATESYDPASHYDRVTAGWALLLGNELHYGVFEDGDEPLDVATHRLTELMVDAARLEPGLRVLDVGCGSGAPACDLARTYGVSVVGITTSQVGVETARARAEREGVPEVSFEQRDGTDNGFPVESFDRVWVLEASHLMPDRKALIAESARVLRPGGRLVLCDIIRRREIPFLEVRERRREFATLRAAHGAARMDPLEDYVRLCEDAGLEVDQVVDLTDETLPTFDRWAQNVRTHRARVDELMGKDNVDAFEESCTILDAFWRDGTLGYGLLSAQKPATAG